MDSLCTIRAVLALLSTAAVIDVSTSQQKNNPGVNSPPSGTTQNVDYFFYQRSEYPKDCQEVQRQCSTTNSSGVYIIKPDGTNEPFEVFCNNEVDTGGWTVIQRRENGYVNFNRSWAAYKEGFGFLSTEFWLGNEKLSYLTNQGVYELRIDLQLSSGASFYTTYQGFRVTDEFGQYKLSTIGAFESSNSSLITWCPTNMEYGTCDCQTTCADPNGESGCHRTCSGDEGCVCPDGFSMHGDDCIPNDECGCFLREANLVIPNRESYINADCTQNCSCNNNQLSCVSITCSENAECVTTDGETQCSCNDGYDGDGKICDALYTDCKDVFDARNLEDGIYTIMPSGWTGEPFRVYCKMDNGGGWTVFQRRVDGSTNFHRSWNEYKQGFGDLVNFNEDFWLGNDKLYYLTNQKNYKLRFDVTTSDGSHKYGEYTEFQIESESTNYRMNKLGSHSGTTGTWFYRYRGKQFSTLGSDNDECRNFDCAEKHRSGWWHSNYWCDNCYESHCFHFYKSGTCWTLCNSNNLNGEYNGGNGENIFTRAPNAYCNVRSVEMKIRPSF